MSVLYLFSITIFIGCTAAVYQGFNYGSVFSDGSSMVQSDYRNAFAAARNLVGTSGFTSARLFTMIQAGTKNSPTEAIPAAIETDTSLLLGLWASAGSAIFNNEVDALTSAISKYGTRFTSLIAGIAVGSEDLYRNSPIGIEKGAGIGANPSEIVNYIRQVRSAIANTPASNALVGHVDTWTVWVNSSNNAVISASDFIGMDSYPYFQTTAVNSIEFGYNNFFQTVNSTKYAVGNKPVWITETGWPVSGPTENLAVASVQNAEIYWDQVGCALFGQTNTWWYTFQDSYPKPTSPSFGIVGSRLSTTPLFNLTCPGPQSKNQNPSSPLSTETTTSIAKSSGDSFIAPASSTAVPISKSSGATFVASVSSTRVTRSISSNFKGIQIDSTGTSTVGTKLSFSDFN